MVLPRTKYQIVIRETHHLVEWLRFIQQSRPREKLNWWDRLEIDFRNVQYLQPFYLASIACLIEEYRRFGARWIRIRFNNNTKVAQYLRASDFTRYWSNGFDRNNCLKSKLTNVLPIWQYDNRQTDSFANLAQNFYQSHCAAGKDLTPLRLSVVEALNNITDHASSPVGGFIHTQFVPKRKEIVICICDFGNGIPNKVNAFLKSGGRARLPDNLALEKALEDGFSTHTAPHNRGFGLDTILSNVNAANGEIQIVSNQAFFALNVKGRKKLKTSDNIKMNFGGTYLVIRLNTEKFLKLEPQPDGEFEIF